MYQGPPQTPKTPEVKPILSFEEFSFRDPEQRNTPTYNNFFTFFTSGWMSEAYRTQEQYKKFESEHPETAKQLCDKIQNRAGPYYMSESLKPFDKELYEVYKIMRGYGYSNSDLFH